MDSIPLSFQLIIFFFAVVFHEFSHGWVAMKCGDDTAKNMGRLTLNPISHVDIIGTILFPLFLIVSNSRFIFGWAKPVPINPYRFNNPAKDTMKVSLAGPLSNVLLAVLSAFAVWIMQLLNVPINMASITCINLLRYNAVINLMLAVFNLIPVPPLDGGRILEGLLPYRVAFSFRRIEPFGFVIVILLLSSGILWNVIIPIVHFLYNLLFRGVERGF